MRDYAQKYILPDLCDFDSNEYFCKYCKELLESGDSYDGEVEMYEGRYCWDLYHTECAKKSYEDKRKRALSLKTQEAYSERQEH